MSYDDKAQGSRYSDYLLSKRKVCIVGGKQSKGGLNAKNNHAD
jgi:hypothetical protein